MQNIFYAALALHIAGKPVGRENIRAVLKAAGTSVDEQALDAVAAFVESLESAHGEKEKGIDPRIIKFLSSELAQQKARTERLEALLEELARSVPLTRAPSREDEISAKVSQDETGRDEVGALARAPAEEAEVATGEDGRYVYGIAACRRVLKLGKIGIDGNEVYTVPYRDLCAVVHNCPAEPYQSSDDEVVKNWVRTHQRVLDEVRERLGTVIPLGFDTILQPKGDCTSPEQVVRNWLEEDYDRLCAVMEKIEGKDEYGVQIFYDPKVIGELVAKESQEVREIREEMATKSPGMAYMYRQKLEKALKGQIEKLADEWFRDFYGRIKRLADDIVVEKTKKLDKDKVMLLNVSCLVDRRKADRLGDELEEIAKREGFSVRFTGPWPPYSFVAKPTVEARQGQAV